MPPRIQVDVALVAAIRQLEQAVVEQERAVNRILGLVELLMESKLDQTDMLRLEGIMESCSFQDLTGQRIRKVNGFMKHLAKEMNISIAAPPPEPDKKEGAPARKGLSQEDVDRLLKG